MWHNLVSGLTSLGGGPSIAYLVGGALIGMIVGVIPGLGGAVVLSIVLVFVYHINLVGTLCLFLGTQAGSYYSASITSILLNTPAHPEAFAITFDGFPMARRGEAGRALGLSAASTCVGGVVGCIVLVGFIQIIRTLPNLFHPPEYIAIVALAMLLVGTLGTDSVAKAVASVGLGFAIASIGPSSVDGTLRFTFSSVGLYAGVSLVALALGCFAIPQMAMVFGTGTTVARQDMTGREMEATAPVELGRGVSKQLIGGVLESFKFWRLQIQSGLIGALTGVVPGMGGFTANFLSYGVAQQTTRKGGRRELFGTGIPEGIIAPEGSSLSKEAGSMIPILGLGIPGGVGGALFLGALTIKGILPGVTLTQTNPKLAYQVVWIIALSGIIGTATGVLVGPLLAKVTKVPGPLLIPFIFALCVVGPYLADVSFFSVMEVLLFAFVGLALRRLRYSLGSFAMGLVLGPTFEQNVYLTRNVYKGFSFLVDRPFADVLFALCIVVVVLKGIELHRAHKALRASESAELAEVADTTERERTQWRQAQRRSPYPFLSLCVTLILLALAIPFTIYGATHYNFTNSVMPVIAGALIVLPVACLLPGDVRNYVFYRRHRASGLSGSDAVDAAATPMHELAFATAGPLGSTETLQFVSHATPDELVDEMDPVPDASNTTKQLAAIRDKSWGIHGQYTREVVALLWFVGIIALCYVFGFLWGVPAFCVVYGMVATRRFFPTLMGRITFSVLNAALMWFVTYELFHVIHLTFSPVVNL